MISLTTWKCEKCLTSFDTRKYKDCDVCGKDLIPVVWVLKSEHEEEMKKQEIRLSVLKCPKCNKLVKGTSELVRIKKEIETDLDVLLSEIRLLRKECTGLQKVEWRIRDLIEKCNIVFGGEQK